MSKTAVESERVFVATVTGISNRQGYFGSVRRGQLLNEVRTVKWECKHNHKEQDAALQCAETQRKRWIASGRAPADTPAVHELLDKIESQLTSIDASLDIMLLARRLRGELPKEEPDDGEG